MVTMMDTDSVRSGYTSSSRDSRLARSLYRDYRMPSRVMNGVAYMPADCKRMHDDVRNGMSNDPRSMRTYSKLIDQRSLSPISPPPAPVSSPNMGDKDSVRVQILHQEETWGENTTAITSDKESSTNGDLSHLYAIEERRPPILPCRHYIAFWVTVALCVTAYLTPASFIVLPQIMWDVDKCGTVCDGIFISMGFKMLILGIGTWALFFRLPKATLPSIFVYRTLIQILIFMLVLSYWLFYVLRIFMKRDRDFRSTVEFSATLLDALLFIHYLSLVLLELCHQRTMFTIKVIRTTDGEARFYNIGQLTIQRAAAWVLEHYYSDFPIFNPHLLNVPSRGAAKNYSGFKFYNVDGSSALPNTLGASRAMIAAAARKRDASHNDRFYEEQDYDRRVRKRRARLVVAAEEAFTHIKRLENDSERGISNMDPIEAAQAVFPSMAHALQKYLRVSRQQHRFTLDSIMDHLGQCISLDFTPKAFLERYLVSGPVLTNSADVQSIERWEVISDNLLIRSIKDGVTFTLRQGGVSLVVYVVRMPHFSLKETVVDPKENRFTLRLQSETSV